MMNPPNTSFSPRNIPAWLLLLLIVGPMPAMAQEIVDQDLSAYEEALSLRLNQGCPFTAVPDPQSPSCNGTGDGQACVIEPVDGVGPYNYLWVGFPDTDMCLENVGAGTYTCIVIDVGDGGTSCGVDVMVTEPAPMAVFSIQTDPPSCFGECDGTADPIVIGGNGGFTFLYDSGENTQMADQLCNPFSLTVTDSEGCTIDTTYTYTDEPLPISIVAVIDSLSCHGDMDGEISIVVSGGTSPYDIAWTGPDGFSSTDLVISGLSAGTYDVTITDANACVQTGSYELVDPDDFSFSATVTEVACFGDETGAIDIEVTGATPPYIFSWAGPNGFVASTDDISALAGGNYSLTISDDRGCTLDTSIIVPEGEELIFGASWLNISCFGLANGSIDLNFTSDCSLCTYAWTGPDGYSSTDEDISGLDAGMYTVVITYNGGCTADAGFEILEPEEILINADISPLSCNGGDDGAIDVTVTGGVPLLSYSWTGPGGFTSMDEDLTDLSSGTYVLTVTDASNCSAMTSITLDEPQQFQVDETITDVTCEGESTGAIELDIIDGSPPFSFVWTGPGGFSSTDEDISGLIAGDYTVSITDNTTCSLTATYTVSSLDALGFIDVSLTDVDCNGGVTGAISLTVIGGQSPYSVLWTGPNGFSSTDEDISGLAAGDYQITVTDINTCQAGSAFTIIEPAAIVLDATATDLSCSGIPDGSIDLIISGGTTPYTVSWVGPDGFTSTAEDITDLAAGTYTATVTDANDCEESIDVSLTSPDAIVISANVDDVNCNGEATGSINISISNGTPNYIVSWTGPNGFSATGQTLTDLLAGTYTVSVTDANNCTGMSDILVEENSALGIDAILSEPACNGEETGSIDVTASGGSPIYFYVWTGPNGFSSIQEDISALGAGVYGLTLTDSLGCSMDTSFMLAEPSPLQLMAMVSDIDCFGQSDGAISVSIAGGTSGYTYAWTGPLGFSSDASAISGLEAGIYELMVTDANDCVLDTLFEVIEPTELIISTTIVQPSCDLDNGSLDIAVVGGTVAGDYTYSILDGDGMEISSSSFTTGLGAGSYTVIVEDDNGCTATTEFDLSNEGGSLSATITAVSCPGQMDGTIDLETQGLTGTLTYAWTGPNGFTSMDQDISGLSGGIYEVTVEDELGCTAFGEYMLDEPTTIDALGVIVNESCAGLADGSIDITLGGGTPGYSFEWVGPNGFSSLDEDISGLASGVYQLVVTDANDCGGLFFFEIEAGLSVEVDGLVGIPLCHGDDNGSISITLDPPTPGSTYIWTGPNGFMSIQEDISGLVSGTYTVTVTTPQFCTAMESFTVPEIPAIMVDLQVQQASCGESSGGATATVTGGTVFDEYGYEYIDLSDMSVVGINSTLENASAGTYQLTVTDDNGCTAMQQFSISDDSGTITAVVTDLFCFGGNDGSIDVTIAGAATPYDIDWEGPNGFSSLDEDISGLSAGDYTITVVDADGCVLSETYSITEAAVLAMQATIEDVDCNGSSTGSISIEHLNGASPFVHMWTGPDGFTSTDEDISDLAAGTYELSFTDANDCEGQATYEVNEPAALSVGASLTHNGCFGEMNGAIDLSITGGVGPFNVIWTGPNGFSSIFQDISGLAAGMYEVAITDARGCPIAAVFEILQEAPILIDVISLDNTTCNMNDGAVVVSASGGAGAYTYSWENGGGASIGNGPSLGDLAPDQYTVTVVDDEMCETMLTIEIFNTEVTFSAEVTDPLCDGDDNGSIDLSVVGNPASPYDIEWTGPNGFDSEDEDIDDLSDGGYTVTLNDANGCIYSADFIIDSPDALAVTSVDEDLECAGSATGSIQTTVTGGTEDYDFQWTGPDGFESDAEDLDGLAGGAYSLLLTDDNGCQIGHDVTLDEPEAILIDGAITDPECEGIDNGAIDVTPDGGQGQLQYSWEGPDGFTSIQEDLVSLGQGTYVLTATDQNGCQQTGTFILEGGQVMTNEIDVMGLDCFGDTDASIMTELSGGTPEYFISWTGPDGFTSGNSDIAELIPGEYILTVIDDLGCIRRDTVMIEEPEELLVSETQLTDPPCFGIAEGAIDITVIGGTPDYAVLWTYPGGATNDEEDITILPAGEFELEVTDANGCVLDTVFTLGAPEAIEVIVEDIQGAECSGSPDGSIDITGQGGSGALTFDWVGPGGSTFEGEDLVDIIPGLYSVTVTDAADCTYEETFIVTADNLLQADGGSYDPICAGTNVTLDASNSVSAESFVWTDLSGQTISNEEQVTILATSQNSIFVLTASNDICVSTDTLYLEVNPNPQPDAGEDVSLFFEEVAMLGGSPTAEGNVTYDWEPSMQLDDPSAANPLFIVESTIQFIVTVTDENGCLGSDFIQVTLIPNVSVPDGFSPNGDETNDRWTIGNSNQFPDMTVVVVNRWGNTVFESVGYRSRWDGKFEDVDVPVGTYYYVIELHDQRFPDPITGPVTIFR